jgi:hypothetical protein
MKKLIALLLTAIGLAVAAPLAGADTGAANSSDAFYLKHTGGVSPQ